MYLSLLDLMRQAGALLDRFPTAAPEFELATEGTSLVIRVKLPGVDPQSVKIQVGQSTLAIGGHSSREERLEGPDFYRYQSGYSQFYRELPLPVRVNPHMAAARWEGDGVLVVSMPLR